jgi:tetratricopeptide (TPR) repeat protein
VGTQDSAPPRHRFKNKETVGTFKDFVQIVVGLLTIAIPLLKVKKEKKRDLDASLGVADSPAGGDINVAHGSIQTGGLNAQGNVTAGRDVVARDKVIEGDSIAGNKIINYPQPPPAVLTPRFQLPPPPADFTGREAELRDLHAAIGKGGILISGLQGQGGVGKTALALKLAAELAPKFPDAQIYLDLKGVSERPLTAAEAMSHVLLTFHPEAKLPEKEHDLCALFRSVLRDKRALLLMDNAKDAAQVQSLVPPEGCSLLVTSRYRFTLPGLQQKNLDTLPPGDATRLLLRIAPRIDGEAEAIAKLCGYLALALRLAATAIAERVDLAPAEYRQRLADERHRLKLLGGDEGVEASITLSYNLLEAEAKKCWRMLAVFPDTIDALAASAVWEIETDTAKETLSRLLQYSMIEWNDGTIRYRLHDLTRDFLRSRLSADESRVARLRHATHYLEVLRSAHVLYEKGAESLALGLALFDLEWENIQAGQTWAEAHSSEDREAAQLNSGYADWGTRILRLRQHPREHIRWREAALAAARQLKDRTAEGRHLDNLGLAYVDLGDTRRAIAYFEEALVIGREVGDRSSVGMALGNLGIAYGYLGNPRRAIEYFEQHLAIAREIGDRSSEGHALGNLGAACGDIGEARRAIEYFQERLAITREIGDREGEGHTLVGLGIAYEKLGKPRRAIEYHDKALVASVEIGDRQWEGMALGGLGTAYGTLSDHRRAIGYYQRQLAVTREIGDRRNEGYALWNTCVALDRIGIRKEAIECAEAALKIFEEIEDPNAAKARKQLEEWRSS